MRTRGSVENRPVGYRLVRHGVVSDTHKRMINRLPTRIDIGVCIQDNAHDIAFVCRFELYRNGLKEALHIAEWLHIVETRNIAVSAYMLHDMFIVGPLYQQYVAAQLSAPRFSREWRP